MEGHDHLDEVRSRTHEAVQVIDLYYLMHSNAAQAYDLSGTEDRQFVLRNLIRNPTDFCKDTKKQGFLQNMLCGSVCFIFLEAFNHFLSAPS